MLDYNSFKTFVDILTCKYTPKDVNFNVKKSNYIKSKKFRIFTFDICKIVKCFYHIDFRCF